jgi:hypothetical protein
VVIVESAIESHQIIWFDLGYPTEELFIGEDTQGDPRMKEALRAAGLLQ